MSNLPIKKSAIDPIGSTTLDMPVPPPQSGAQVLELMDSMLLSRQSERLMVAFDNIREGLGMYDGAERLVMMNPRYAQMYQVPPVLRRPGTQFGTLLKYWTDIGLLHRRESRENRSKIEASQAGGCFRLHLLDGRTYEVNEQPLPGGGWVSTHEDITDRVSAERRILYLAQHDMLTGLYNRAAFQERLQRLLEPSGHGPVNTAFAVLMLDLDRFKPINDLYGHSAGDQVLIEVANRIRTIFGGDAMIARVGGDEFAVIVERQDEPLDRDAVTACAQRMASDIRKPITGEQLMIDVGASIGIAYFPDHGQSASELLKSADRALYTAKHQPTSPVVTYHADLDAAENARVALIRRLPQALQNGEIELYFQPIVDAATGACHTAEALLRWTHPDRGPIPPEHIIAIAEESRLINQLGYWILKRALEAARTWPETVSVAVNLSASQFKMPGFCTIVKGALAAAGLPPHRLELELTETVLCSDDAIATINILREAGVRFSLDDFGTGYASMSYLLRFPFDRVKIDRSFVTEVDERRDRRLVVEAVAGLATKLGLDIVAEGVETNAERAVVTDAGCSFLQGYLFARPMPEADFLAFIRHVHVDAAAAAS